MTNNSSHENPAFDNLSSLDRIPQQIYPTSIYAISNQQNAPSQISTGPLPRKKQSILSNSKFRKYLLAGIIISIVFIIVIIGLVVALIVINGDKSQSSTTTSSPSTSYQIKQSNCSYGYYGDYCDECGLTSFSQNLKIVGGVDAVAHSWPSIAYILFVFSSSVRIPNTNTYVDVSQTYRCGGTLISRNTVLTAAHCIVDQVSFEYNGVSYYVNVDKTIVSRYKVYLGVQDRSNLEASTVSYRSVSQIITHPDYNSITDLNDIAIIKLSTDVQLNQYVQIACLPNPIKTNYPVVSSPSWAVGWGTLFENGPSPRNLNNVKLTIYDGTQCRNVLPSQRKNWDSQLCSGLLTGGADTCQGDSGGPLFVQDTVNGVNKFVLSGVTSYGDGCGKVGLPGIYTRVSYYLNWINNYS